MERILCYGGKVHYNKADQVRDINLYFSLAIAKIHCVTEQYYGVPMCVDHLNSYLDYADDHPDMEPDKIEWLNEN
jgi:hypothetical protein